MRIAVMILALLLGMVKAAPLLAQAAAPRVEMELVTEEQIPPTAAQTWYQLLTELKVTGLRVRPAQPADKPAVTSTGRPEAPAYKVVGVIERDGGLLLPGTRLRATDRAAVADWLSKLREGGPQRARGGRPVPFGLRQEQLDALRKELARPVSFSTKDLATSAFVDRAADALRTPLTGDTAATRQLAAAAPIDVELSGMSMGTALAYVLARVDLALVPALDAQRQPALTITLLRPKQQRWPIGWPAQQPRRELVPALFENVDVEINDVELPRVLAAVGEHVAVPILVDEQALAADKIELAKVKVSLPAKRSAYELVLRKILVPKALAHEVRIDESDRPFVWITTARRVAVDAKAKTKDASP